MHPACWTMLSLDVFLNVSFSSTAQTPPGTMFQLMGPWYSNACCPYDLVLAEATLKIFGFNNECSGLAGVYTFKSFDRYFGYAVVNAVWHRESILQAILLGIGSQCNFLRRGVVCSVLGILSVIRAAVFWTLEFLKKTFGWPWQDAVTIIKSWEN